MGGSYSRGLRQPPAKSDTGTRDTMRCGSPVSRLAPSSWKSLLEKAPSPVSWLGRGFCSDLSRIPRSWQTAKLTQGPSDLQYWAFEPGFPHDLRPFRDTLIRPSDEECSFPPTTSRLLESWLLQLAAFRTDDGHAKRELVLVVVNSLASTVCLVGVLPAPIEPTWDDPVVNYAACPD